MPPLFSSLRFKHLRLIDVLARTRNLHKMAAELNITQPGATKMLREVEAMLGVSLFDRTKRPLAPSEIGQHVVDYARRTLTDGNRFASSVANVKRGGFGALAIGAIMATAPDLLPKAIAELKRRRPLMTIQAGGRLCSDLGEDFEFKTVTYKPYPSCQFLRSMIGGLGVLRQQASDREVEAIEVRLHPFEANFIGVRFKGPFTNAAQTVMSAPFCAALAWLTGTTSYAALRNLTDPEVLHVVSRVAVIDDDTLPRYHSRLRVFLRDGRVLEREENGESSAYELTWDSAVRATKLLCGEAGTAAEAVRGLVDTVSSVDRMTTVRPIIDAARAAIESAKEPPPPSLASRAV